MIRVSKHDHIVNFQGLCVYNESVYLLIEFCALGPIDEFLQRHSTQISYKMKNQNYDELLQWCSQVADGMGFLAKKMILHVGLCKIKHTIQIPLKPFIKIS
jgi:serine/threonine protein kinase